MHQQFAEVNAAVAEMFEWTEEEASYINDIKEEAGEPRSVMKSEISPEARPLLMVGLQSTVYSTVYIVHRQSSV